MHPIADGTFIQMDMVKNWTDENWISEFQYLSEAKMGYIVLTAPKKTDAGVVEMCLRNAQDFGLKVFIGIHFDEAWWKKGSKDKEWLFEQMKIGASQADIIYEQCYYKNPDSFYGWYFAYEVDNISFNNRAKFESLARALDILLNHLKNGGHRLPIMLSPFMNSSIGSARDYAENWAYLFARTELGERDVFCPQDSVGGGGLEIQEIDEWFRYLKKAVDRKPGLQFWANVETFDHRTWSSAILKRFIRQMEIAGRYAEKIMTFSYSHYYSPNNIDKRFHDVYLYYAETGHLEEENPLPPKSIKVVKKGISKHIISWESGSSSIGIFGYELFRNGKKIFGTFEQRRYGGKSAGIVHNFVDRSLFKWRLLGTVYEVRTVDFAGNTSQKTKARVYI
ncbi:MAG: DUF4434 domain-containing protein [Clostridiaceae bacterium]